MLTSKTHRIALLFNGNKVFDREVIAGIAAYLASTRSSWDLFLEEDFRVRLPGIDRWQGDGIIADFDDPAVAAALAPSRIPVVAVGGSYADPGQYPAGVPYVATDNFKLIELAYQHLIDAGLSNFALFSLPEAQTNRWAQEREHAFRTLMRRDRLTPQVFRGHGTGASLWGEAVREQIAWLESLPKPVGIIAVNDGRACQLLQACAMAGIEVPQQVALIGIDNDPLARMLTRVPMSSVAQGAHEMGNTAAQMLDQMLHGVRLGETRILVPPVGINALESSRHEPDKHPHVMRARHFIRRYACQGIKNDQVAEYVGISRSSLESYFRNELGFGVHDEILRCRIEAASAILQRGDCNLDDVARKCGFSSSQYMHSVFKRELGCSPRSYQERVLTAGDERGREARFMRQEPARPPAPPRHPDPA